MKTPVTMSLVLFAGLVSGAAHAGSVLSDNFESDAYALNWSGDSSFASLATPSTSGNGGVASTDLIGPGFFAGLCGNGTRCVDLDGTTGGGNTPSGVLQSNATFGPGVYTLRFALNGNNRGAPSQTTTVTVGNQTIAAITLASNAPYQLYTYTFTTTAPGTLDFTESGPSTQQGALLDDVNLVTGVPEPVSWALMLVGLGSVGAIVRARRSSVIRAA